MSDDEAASLFGGKKFWITIRVPTRNHWIELIEKHGGHTVKLDTQADILIADHARKGAPAGSLSWKFIEDSVKKGKLQDPADYPAGAAVPSSHAIPSRPNGKMSRTPYTVEDDRELWDWVTKAESRGVSVSGNKLYQELEAKNPRHTWHSWRDRWLKSLAYRERPASTTNHKPLQPQSLSRAPTPRQNVGKRRAPPSSSSLSNRHVAADAVPTTLATESANNSPSPRRQSSSDSEEEVQAVPLVSSFTSRDERVLLSMATEIESIDPERITEAWDAFAEEYPQHSGEEWKNFWDEVIKPSKKRLGSKKAKKSPPMSPRLKKDGSAPISPQKIQSSEKVQKTQEITSRNGNEGRLEVLDRQECQKTSEDLVVYFVTRETPIHFTVTESICGDRVLIYDICRAVTSAFEEDAKLQRPGRWEEVARLLGIQNSPSRIAVLKEKFSRAVDGFFDFESFILHLKNIQQETESDEGSSEEVDEDISVSLIELPQEEQNPGKRRRAQSEDQIHPRPGDFHTVPKNSMNETRNISKRQRIDKGKGKELEIPPTPEPLRRRLPQRHEYQNFAQDPETQDFHFPQATQDEEIADNYGEVDSPSNQIHDEVYRATQRSTEPDTEPSEAHGKVTRGKIDRYIALGYSKEVVCEALGATTSNDQNAAIVMEELTQGKGIPENLRGVWTAEDDMDLKEPGGMERMVEKHGSDHVEDRIIWLEVMEEIRRELSSK